MIRRLLAVTLSCGCMSCFLIAPELPDGDTFTGQVKLNQTWSQSMADPSSSEFQLTAQEFSTFVSIHTSLEIYFLHQCQSTPFDAISLFSLL